MEAKVCTHCNTAKALTEYGRHKLCVGGLNPQCKQCNRERVRAYQAMHGDDYKRRKHEYDKARWAAGLSKDRTGWREANRDHLTAKKREWAQANPDKVRAVKQNYKHKRRAQEATELSWSALRTWTDGQRKVCYWCGTKTASGYHVDHYQPLSKGGRHELSNLVIACAPCNLRKSAKDPLAFAQEVGRLL